MANADKITDATANYDAQQLAEEIATGEEKAPKVNVEDDYERSKEFDVADIDRTAEGAKAADKATSLQSSSGSTPSEGKAPGDPNAYREMAQDVTKPSDD